VVEVVSHFVTVSASFIAVDPVTPNSTGLPGVNGLHTLMSWLMFIALTICASSAILSGATVAYAHHTSRPDMAVRAKVGLLWALGGAFLIGISIPLVNAFYGLG
jgi:uncharacterized membrane protein (DUF441 family)